MTFPLCFITFTLYLLPTQTHTSKRFINGTFNRRSLLIWFQKDKKKTSIVTIHWEGKKACKYYVIFGIRWIIPLAACPSAPISACSSQRHRVKTSPSKIHPNHMTNSYSLCWAAGTGDSLNSPDRADKGCCERLLRPSWLAQAAVTCGRFNQCLAVQGSKSESQNHMS